VDRWTLAQRIPEGTMLVVKIELHSANTGEVKEIGRMHISNVGGTNDRGDYKVDVLKRGAFRGRARQSEYRWGDLQQLPTTRTGSVENYPRLSYNVWRLVLRALRSAFPEEKNG
jgi:hypothetical protein